MQNCIRGMYRKAHNPSETPMPILHRDIKSENILLTAELMPKLADLGEARAMAENGAMTQVGTNGWLVGAGGLKRRGWAAGGGLFYHLCNP